MWKAQKMVGEGGERRKGLRTLDEAAWAYGEEPYDCHLVIDGVLSKNEDNGHVCLIL